MLRLPDRAGALDQGRGQGGADRQDRADLPSELIPGTIIVFSQPIELRFSDMLAGVKGDVGIGLYGDDLAVLQEKAEDLARVAQERARAPPT